MITGKTSSGFEFELQEHVLDDMELLDAIVEADENPAAIPKIVNMVLGKEGKQRLYDHLRTEHGNVPIMKVAAEVAEIFNCSQQGKN